MVIRRVGAALALTKTRTQAIDNRTRITIPMLTQNRQINIRKVLLPIQAQAE